MKRYNRLSIISAALILIALSGCESDPYVPTSSGDDDRNPNLTEVTDIDIVIRTSKGDIEATLFASQAPLTCSNFLNLAKRDFYRGITFHRVVDDFMIQGGDPTATGTGGPGYKFEDEIVPGLTHDKPGIFSMANSGPATNGSQFFITHRPTPNLDGRHAVFGEVTKGQDVVDAIRMGDVINKIVIEDSTDALFNKMSDRIQYWNQILDRNQR